MEEIAGSTKGNHVSASVEAEALEALRLSNEAAERGDMKETARQWEIFVNLIQGTKEAA